MDTSADPILVEVLVKAMTQAIEDSTTPDTTTADLASAAFTILDRVLRGIKNTAPHEDVSHNQHEIGRILQTMIDEYGSTVN